MLTVPIPLATTPREVFDGCDADAVLALLLHKLVQAASEVHTTFPIEHNRPDQCALELAVRLRCDEI